MSSCLSTQLMSALKSNSDESDSKDIDRDILLSKNSESGIMTTEEEIQAFYIVKGMLAEFVNSADITYRDTESYFEILFKDHNRKPICRINLHKKGNKS